jgi:cell cycle checkpoint control protein RAD9A
MHALFDRSAAKNRWTISARVLRDFAEHFGPKTEQLDFYSENGRATFTSYTEKITDGKGMTHWRMMQNQVADTALLKRSYGNRCKPQ